MDERLPVKKKPPEDGSKRKPIFGRCNNAPHELWVALIEKACAKVSGCYGNLGSGFIDEGVQMLTGFQPEKCLIRNENTGLFPHEMVKKFYGGEDGFWGFLMARRQDNCLLGCSIKGYGKCGLMVIDGSPTGLLYNHAYAI